MKRALLALSLVSALSLSAQQLAPWSPGTLDIHQISTGRGNAAFFIFPDGTTMLVDAGGDAGKQIAGYIKHMMETPRLDYAVLTHYHGDHMAALPEVGRAISIGTYIDRGTSFLPPPGDDAAVKTYRAFVADKHNEAIRVGANDQIVLKHDAAAYKNFEVRNVAANGEVWNGEGNGAHAIFPATYAPDDKPTENMCSIGLRIRYGKFDYFTGGDMPGVPDAGAPEWWSVETAVAKAIGPTDVHVANHHGSIDPESAFFLATLKSPVIILPAWSPTHPSQDSLKRMLAKRLYPGPHDIFVTKLYESTKESIGSRVDQLKAQHGHIVVRVAPGGDHYQVFVLDDTSDDLHVVAMHGPYAASGP